MICSICLKSVKENEIYGLHHHCFKQNFQLKELSHFVEFKRLRTSLEGSVFAPEDSSREAQFHGHYPKFSVRLDGKRHIIKFGKLQNYPLLAEAEAVCNALATILEIPVATPFALLRYKNRKCFVVKDFLQSKHPENLIHLWDLWPEYKGKKTPFYLSTLIELLSDQVTHNEVRSCLELLLFDYLIGNGDRHRNNLALIESARSTKKIAPFYDNVTDLGLESGDFLDPNMRWHPSLKVEIQGKDATIEDYLAQIVDYGFGDGVQHFQRKLKKGLPEMIQLISGFPLHLNLRSCLKDLLGHRSKEILKWK